jgi:hypothetical protein
MAAIPRVAAIDWERMDLDMGNSLMKNINGLKIVMTLN